MGVRLYIDKSNKWKCDYQECNVSLDFGDGVKVRTLSEEVYEVQNYCYYDH